MQEVKIVLLTCLMNVLVNLVVMPLELVTYKSAKSVYEINATICMIILIFVQTLFYNMQIFGV